MAFPDASLAWLSWVLNAYNIVFAALLVPAGRLADLLGRRRLFFVGLARVRRRLGLCGLAPSVEVLVAARVLQAAGAALLVPTSLGLLLPEFPLEQRATATALWGAVGGVAAATGPSLGGLLISWADWRLVFFVNLVLGVAAWVPARRLLVETRDPDRGAVPDALGIGLLAGGVGRCRWRSSRRRTGAGGARGCWLSFAVGVVAAGCVRLAVGGASRIRCWSWRCSACGRSRRRARACSCSRSASTRCCWPTSCS